MKTLAERFEEKLEPEPMSGCFLWVGSCNKAGYGRFRIGNRIVVASRFAYELVHGPLPKGKYALHSCDNPPCCNHRHLRAGSQQENVEDRDRRKRDARSRGIHANALKTHCPSGHPYDEKNTGRYRKGYRICRECARVWSAQRYTDPAVQEKQKARMKQRYQDDPVYRAQRLAAAAESYARRKSHEAP